MGFGIKRLHSNAGGREVRGLKVSPATGDCDGRLDAMLAPRQVPQDFPSLDKIARLSQHLSIYFDQRIAGQDQGVWVALCHRIGLALCEGPDELVGGPVRHKAFFVDRIADVEWNAEKGEQVAAARRGRGQH